jgi:hypothetical protein
MNAVKAPPKKNFWTFFVHSGRDSFHFSSASTCAQDVAGKWDGVSLLPRRQNRIRGVAYLGLLLELDAPQLGLAPLLRLAHHEHHDDALEVCLEALDELLQEHGDLDLEAEKERGLLPQVAARVHVGLVLGRVVAEPHGLPHARVRDHREVEAQDGKAEHVERDEGR